jgi:23S rRNA (cytosine1962-C5)-methyltransferase
MIKVFLKKGREEAPSRGHPWVFSGAIERVEGEIEVGGLADLFTHAKEFLGRGYYNPRSQIAVRLLTRQPVAINKAFFRGRMQAAFALRKAILSSETTACRLIHAEGDLLPGLICDKYGDYLVLQINTAGMERFRDEIVSLLKDLLPPSVTYDRSDAATRAQEGLPDSTGPIAGAEAEGGPLASDPLFREAAFPDLVEIRENNMRFLVDVKQGQKTGFYLDQRDNRALIRGLAQGKRVLNCFSYTGGFSIAASLGGAASATSVEASTEALALCKENLILNNISLDSQRLIKADIFDFLRDDQEEYDLIILDPPAFAKRKGQVKGAIRGYKDINLYAMKRAKKRGMILTCSCSQHVDATLFQKILSYAAADTSRHLQVLGHWGAPQDHPVALHHPEGAYLKAFLLRVVE